MRIARPIPTSEAGNGGRGTGRISARKRAGPGTVALMRCSAGPYPSAFPDPRAARMAGELYPSNQWVAPMPPPSQSANLPVPTGWGSRNFSSDPRNGGVSWRRYAAAIRRYKWMIAGITGAISDMKTGIRDARASVAPDERGHIEVTVEVFDVKHLDKVINSIKGVPGVIDVERMQGAA